MGYKLPGATRDEECLPQKNPVWSDVLIATVEKLLQNKAAHIRNPKLLKEAFKATTQKTNIRYFTALTNT